MDHKKGTIFDARGQPVTHEEFNRRVAMRARARRKARTKMENPPVLLGEAPSKSGDKYHIFPLSGAVAETLCKLGGIQPLVGESRYGQWTWALYDYYECENLIERWPGAQGRGSSFPTSVARANAISKSDEFNGRVVVLLGRRLADVMLDERDGRAVSFYEWRSRMRVQREHDDVIIPCQVVAIPHPSGLNRMLNDPSERDRCGAVLRQARMRAAMLEKA